MQQQNFGPEPEPTEWRDYGNEAYEISKNGYARDKKRKRYLVLVADGENTPFYYFRLPSKKKDGKGQTSRTLPGVVKAAWNLYIQVTAETRDQMRQNIMEWNLANAKHRTSCGAPCNLEIASLDYGDGCKVNSAQYCPFPGVKEW